MSTRYTYLPGQSRRSADRAGGWSCVVLRGSHRGGVGGSDNGGTQAGGHLDVVHGHERARSGFRNSLFIASGNGDFETGRLLCEVRLDVRSCVPP